MSGATRSERGLVAAVFICFAGTFFIMPFLPLYVQELGDFDVATTALWSGAIIGITPLISGASAPFWGMMADRFGRRLMLQRSLFGFAICLGALGLATEPWHLLAIRTFEGIFGGFMTSAVALVSTTSSTERLSIGIGRLHAARVLGMAAGPLPGGLMAEYAGYRAACFVTMAMLFVAFFIVTFTTKETVRRPAITDASTPLPRLREIVATASFVSIFAAVFVTRMAERTFDPVLPLLVAQSRAGTAAGAAIATSVITTAGLIASSAAAVLIGYIASEENRSRFLLIILFLTAFSFAPIVYFTGWSWLLGVRVATGILLGASMTLAVSIAATDTPLERRSAALGIIGSATSCGSSCGVLLAGILSTVTLTLVFAANCVLILISALLLLWAKGWRTRGA